MSQDYAGYKKLIDDLRKIECIEEMIEKDLKDMKLTLELIRSKESELMK